MPKRWFVVISILIVGVVGASDCAITINLPHIATLSASIGPLPVLARHGNQPVVFANLGAGSGLPHNMTLLFKVRDTKEPAGVWLDDFSLGTGGDGVVYYKEGVYEYLVTSLSSGLHIRGKFKVPDRGSYSYYNGCYYAARVLLGGRR
ncbi:MAG: hypothetical protein V1685_01390 [Parcubacteria group bacterium]